MRKIKVLFVTHRSYPYIGGIEMHAHWVNTYLSKDYGSEIEILHLSTDPHKEDITKYNSSFSLQRVKAPYIASEVWPILLPRVKKTITDIIKEFKPNIIHTHNRFVPTSRFITKFARKNYIPLIHTEHTSSNIFSKNKWINNIATYLDNKIIRRGLRNAKAITAVSKSSADLMKKNWKIKNISVTENFITPKNILNFKKDRKPSSKPSLLFVGRLVDVKRYQKLFKFVSSSNQEMGYTLTIIGDGPGKQSAINLATKQANVKYLDRQPHNRVLEEMTKHDISVNLSSMEGLATTIMEAMVMGQTVIATEIPPNKELLDNYPGGILIPIYPTQKDWNKAIKKADIKRLKNYSKEGLELTPTVEKTAKKYYSLYKKFAE